MAAPLLGAALTLRARGCFYSKIHYENARYGYETSCGCYQSEVSSQCHTTHGCTIGHIRTPEFKSWTSAWGRCENPNNKRYYLYGGRGIGMCSGWRNDFGLFFKDMGPRPPGTSIDRIFVNGHYSCGHCEQCIRNNLPMNCRWATAYEQAQNRRNSKKNLGIDNVVPMI